MSGNAEDTAYRDDDRIEHQEDWNEFVHWFDTTFGTSDRMITRPANDNTTTE